MYRLAVALALSVDVGLRASDLNLATAILVALALVAPQIKSARRSARGDSKPRPMIRAENLEVVFNPGGALEIGGIARRRFANRSGRVCGRHRPQRFGQNDAAGRVERR